MNLPENTGEIVGFVTAGGVLFWKFFEGLVSRTVKANDEGNEKRDKEIEGLKTDKIQLQTEVHSLRNTVSNMTDKLTEIRALLQEAERSRETTRDAQANFYRDELKKMERAMREEIARSVAPLIATPSHTRGRAK